MDFLDYRILHPHGGEWVEMRHHHDASDHDIERRLGKGAKVFKCPTCDEKTVIVPRDPKEGAE